MIEPWKLAYRVISVCAFQNDHNQCLILPLRDIHCNPKWHHWKLEFCILFQLNCIKKLKSCFLWYSHSWEAYLWYWWQFWNIRWLQKLGFEWFCTKWVVIQYRLHNCPFTGKTLYFVHISILKCWFLTIINYHIFAHLPS